MKEANNVGRLGHAGGVGAAPSTSVPTSHALVWVARRGHFAPHPVALKRRVDPPSAAWIAMGLAKPRSEGTSTIIWCATETTGPLRVNP